LDQEKAQEAEKAKREKSKIDPKTMFKNMEEYTQFDDQGIPTQTKDGPISKGAQKKFKKLHEAQAKLHASYLKSLEEQK